MCWMRHLKRSNKQLEERTHLLASSKCTDTQQGYESILVEVMFTVLMNKQESFLPSRNESVKVRKSNSSGNEPLLAPLMSYQPAFHWSWKNLGLFKEINIWKVMSYMMPLFPQKEGICKICKAICGWAKTLVGYQEVGFASVALCLCNTSLSEGINVVS